jgi:hypothetical protein
MEPEAQYMEEVEVGKVVQTLLGTYPQQQQRVDVKFSNPDVNYLQTKTRLDHKFVARMLRIFGEEVVVESLRRFATRRYQHKEDQRETSFIYICRGVESVGKDG